ncbi:MAG: Asp-tRNA(Asn)/Glu-tRNA(Gln) amidotransferase subunit GatA [Patescibacteria group bacterium]|nr:Asp-tRNA(Asn)/Glu-tRNA(Gln) amidotransferase subunit GatA [Patescibacteria group bacterium]
MNKLTIKQAQERLEAGEISSVDLAWACLDRIKAVDDKVKACLTVCEKEAMVAAEKADEKRAQGEKGDLLGIPYIVKDNIMTKGVKTTAASKILENYIAPFDATIIKKLREAGAVLLGKSNLDEFAHGASTENSAFGSTHNPWDLERVPGGSSGGSAAAVAADMCLFALGTDTGGSIRCPASFCGVTGLKPTYGLASRFGLIAMTSSTDVPGPITKTAEDAKIVMDVIAGVDKNDATTVNVSEINSEVSELSSGCALKGKKIGIPKEYFNEGLEPEVKKLVTQAVDEYKKQGAEIINVSLPHNKYSVGVYYIITPSEISSNLARFDGIRYGFSDKESKELIDIYKKSRGKGFGSEAKRRIMLGTYVLSAGYFDAYYLKAQKVRTIIKKEFDQVLSKVDCVITPTSPHTAFKIGEQAKDPLKMYLEDVYVSGASLSGLPAISIPVGFSNGLPVGMQIIGKRFFENALYKMGSAFQNAADYHKQKPEL